MKIKKVKRGKSFRYNVNRKRVNNQRRGTGTIKDPAIRKAWNERKTLTKNLVDMGISRDPNELLAVPSAKQKRLRMIKLANGFVEEELDEDPARPKTKLVEQLEKDANEYRESQFRLPKGVVKYASYLLDKYGLNYKAMVKDEKNHDQETWKQFRAKIRKFMSIPEQFNVYLKRKNLDPENLPWSEYDSDCEQ
ncbi:hypothetical protein HA402_011462 [Bradysia odoriphaga]|nr:hypothetical protein HA402_011462 [Bradysia odoriphaga]